MPNGYHHVTRDKRSQVYALMSRGISQRQIAAQLGVSPSTISREIKRNSGQRGYRVEQADRLAQQRRSNASRRPKKLTGEIRDLIIQCLKMGWSPEQICGRLAREGVVNLCPETIYQMIWKDKRQGGSLYVFLRRRTKPYNRRGNKTAGRGCIPNRVDIDQRPKIVEKKTRIGDWEADTIIGANHKGVIVSVVDRASKFTVLEKVPDKTTEIVTSVIAERLDVLPRAAYTVTFDNGKEFVDHKRITDKTGADCYFAKPYHSWERGLNEHTNGLVREYIPKKTDFRGLPDEAIRTIEELLNHRPRKSLNFRTPHEVFYSEQHDWFA